MKKNNVVKVFFISLLKVIRYHIQFFQTMAGI